MLSLSKLFSWKPNSASSIHEAVAENRLTEMRRILSENARCVDDLDPFGKQGLTPLQMAVLTATDDDTQSIALLLEYGADINKRSKTGLTALILACIQPEFSLEKRIILIQILTNADARLNLDNPLDKKAFEIFQKNYPTVYNMCSNIIITPVKTIVINSQSHGNNQLRHRHDQNYTAKK